MKGRLRRTSIRYLLSNVRLAVYVGLVLAWAAYYCYKFYGRDPTSYELFKMLVFGALAFAPIGVEELYDNYAAARKRRREQQAEAGKQRQHAPAAGLPPRTDLYVLGPPPFMHSVYRVLNELRDKTPARYQEVVEHLPKVVFDSSLESAGRSDGRFSLDGSGHIYRGGGWYTVNDYDAFRYIFLHEVGHNVCGKQRDDWSEDAADGYAAMVISEMAVSNQ